MDVEFPSLEEAAEYFYVHRDCNCAEALFTGGNAYYRLGVSPAGLRAAAGFGGGMGIGTVCGAITGALMVMGCLFVRERAHEGSTMEEVSSAYLEACSRRFGSLLCEQLKDQFHTPESGCLEAVCTAAQEAEKLISSFAERRIQ